MVNIFRISFCFFLFLGVSFISKGQGITIIGDPSPETNSQIQYLVSYSDIDGVWNDPPQDLLNYNWSVDPDPLLTGTVYNIVYTSNNQLRIVFLQEGTHTIYFTASTYDDYYSGSFTVTSNTPNICATTMPSAEDGSRTGEGVVTLTANSAPVGFTYQWFDASGANLLGTGQNFTTPVLTETTNYKLAYKYTSSGCLTEKVDVSAVINRLNYVKTYEALVPLTSSSALIDGTNGVSFKNFNYYDGLGRPDQQVLKEASSSGFDVVTPKEYDEFNRQVKDFLPYAKNYGANAGDYHTNGLVDQTAYYQTAYSDSNGFSEKELEDSPLGRVLATYAPGSPWAKSSSSGGKPVQMEYLTNTALDEVIIWEIRNGKLISQAFYDQGTLYKSVTTDEESHQVVEFKDLQGRVVLKQVQAPGGTWAKTYYVYDDFGNLIYVLPPEAVKNNSGNDLTPPAGYYLVTEDTDYSAVAGSSGGKIAYVHSASVTVSAGTTLTAGVHIQPFGIGPTQTHLDQWAFQYKYDERQRMIEKKVPGADPVYLVYDRLDRLVLTQDGNQRKSNKWSFTKFDAFDRPILTGEKVISGSLTSIRSAVASHSTLNETYTGSGITKYSSSAYPTSLTESDILTITYYDNYNFTNKTFSLPSDLNSSLNGKVIPVVFTEVRDLVTGTKTKVLGTTSDYIETVNFYDDRYRLIQSKVLNLKNGEDVVSSQYDFAGRLRKTHLFHQNPSADISSVEVVQEYSYDHGGRLLSVTHQIDNGPIETLLNNTYNELGELINKDLADSYEDIDYSYNIRGWLTSINNLSDGSQKLFEMDLEYHDAPNGHKVYNGNIGATAWKNPYESLTNRYDYNYDEMNRLTAADYSNGGVSNMGFDVSGISYDLNGNIKNLTRKGNDENNNPNVTIDNLAYSYANGNQLSKVTDSSGKIAGFKDGANQTTEYLYDENGNMKEDKNKGITSIEYNYLNLPRKVTFSASKYIEYTYDASGAKLSTKVVDSGVTKVSDYLGGFVYENNDLQFLQHEEGRIVVKRDDTGMFDGYQYQYHLKDHLGNVRVTFKTEPEDPDIYLATLENDAATVEYEETYFSRYGEITRINADIFDHTDAGSSKTYSMRLNGAGNEIYGLAKSLAVQPGDVVSAEVWAKYLDPSTTGNAGSAFAQLIQDLSNNASTVVVDAISPGTETMPSFIGLAGSNGVQNAGAPKAYLNMMVFDRNFQQIGNTLFRQISTSAEEDGSDVSHEYLSISPVTITEVGYVYIYLSNENGTPMEVFFDDFKVTHIPTDIVQKDDYYPFGATFNSYFSGLRNNYLFNNGQEWSEEFQLYEFKHRFQDPWIGKFITIDPKAAEMPEWSPYSFSFNNPLVFIDPDGQKPIPVTSRQFRQFANSVGIYGNQQIGSFFERLSITSLQTTRPVMHNTTQDFFSPARQRMNGGLPASVRPDGISAYLGASSRGETFISPSFYEAKATSATLTKRYRKGQITGMIDALANMDRRPNEMASLTLVTTADTKISADILEYATSRGVVVFQSVAALDDETGEFILSEKTLLNGNGISTLIDLLLKLNGRYDEFNGVNPLNYLNGNNPGPGDPDQAIIEDR